MKPLQADDLNATTSKATMTSPIELLMGYKARTRGSSKLLSVIDTDIDTIYLAEIQKEAERLLDKHQKYNKDKFDAKRFG